MILLETPNPGAKTCVVKIKKQTLLTVGGINSSVACFLEASCDLCNTYLLLSTSGTELGTWQAFSPVFINSIYEPKV